MYVKVYVELNKVFQWFIRILLFELYTRVSGVKFIVDFYIYLACMLPNSTGTIKSSESDVWDIPSWKYMRGSAYSISAVNRQC